MGSLAGGDLFGNPADDRVRGVIIDEGAGVCSLTHCDTVTIPALLRDGSPLGPLGGTDPIGDMRPEFDLLVNAFPRYLLTLNDVTHFGFVTGACGLVETLRQLSLLYQQFTLGEIIEPEPRNILYYFVSLGNGDLAGNSASLLWNQDAFFSAGGTFGSAADSCRAEYGGPPAATPAVNGPTLDEQAMIETLFTTDLAFWQTVFGNGKPEKTKLEKAVEKLDTVESFDKVTE